MAKYFFDLRSDLHVIMDEDGADFANDEAAENEARLSVLELAKDQLTNLNTISGTFGTATEPTSSPRPFG